MRIALITGITGQDGSYLAELLLEKDMTCMVPYAVRRSIFVSASLTWKVILISISIMQTSATQ